MPISPPLSSLRRRSPGLTGVLCCFAAAASLRPALGQEFELDRPATILAGGSRVTFDAADVDADNRLDILFATDTGARVFFGRNGFAFDQGPDLMFARSRVIHAADLDGDGLPDAIAGDSIAFTLEVFRGVGGGQFVRHSTLPLGQGREASFITTADLDGDGALDIVTVNERGVDASVLLGDGTGGFSLVGHFDPGGGARNVVVADMDADGHEDLVFANYGPPPRVFTVRYGNGTGLFPARTSGDATPGLGYWVDVADIDGDGRLDLALAMQQSDETIVFEGLGSRSFGPPAAIEAAPGMANVFARDLSGDGRIDLLSVGENVAFVAGSKARGFLLPQLHRDTHTAWWSILGDFDEDGFDDLATSSDSSPVVHFLAADGNGAFGAARCSRVRNSARPISFAVADFNGDGRSDRAILFFIDALRTGIDVRVGDGRGQFSGGATLTFLPASLIVAGDFVEDGLDDLLVVEPFGPLRVFPGDASAGLGAPTMQSRTAFPLSVIAGADFDEDGHFDAIGADLDRGAIAVLRGDGAGGFLAAEGRPVGGTARGMVSGDFDEDGRTDVAVALDDSAAVAILLGDGNGAFGAPSTHSVHPLPERIAASDLDDDGQLDLAAQSRAARDPHVEGAVSVLLGDGAGGFSPYRSIGTVDNFANGLAAGDLDSDGDTDLISVRDTYFDVYLGSGGGDFTPVAISNPVFPNLVTTPIVADFDEDARPDIALLSSIRRTGLGAPDAVSFVFLNRTHWLGDALRGNVNGGAGPTENVLFVNGSPGAGPDRRIDLSPIDPFEIAMTAPSSMAAGPARFVLYKWPAAATDSSVVDLPLGLGRMGAAPPLVLRGKPQFDRCWNNLGRTLRLGVATDPSSPAPSVVASYPRGLGAPATLYLQGFIVDRGARNGRAATTNGVTIVVR